jgi:hypothetical protein
MNKEPPTLTKFVGKKHTGHAISATCEDGCCVTHYGMVAEDGTALLVRRDLINENRFSYLAIILNERGS